MRSVITVLVGLFFSTAAIAAETAAASIERLNQTGQFAEAWELAAASREANEGDPNFDFQMALAAMETGNLSDAVFALERVVMVYPGQRRVRLELGRAHFLSGNFPAARREFQQVMDTNPPADVRRNINAFLERIDQIEAGTDRQTVLFAELYTGFDGNINSATDQSDISIPVGGGSISVELDQDGQEIDSPFLRLNVGGLLNQPLTKRRTLDLGVYASRKENTSNDDFDLSYLRSEAGITDVWQNNDVVRYYLGAQVIGLDTSRFNHSVNTGASWARELSNGALLSFSGNLALIRFNNDDLRDTNQVTISGSLSQSVGITQHSFSVFVAHEPHRGKSAGRHNGRDFMGASYRFDWPYRNDWVAFMTASAQFSEYDREQPTFNKERDDTFLSLQAGFVYTGYDRFTVRAHVTWADQKSNIEIYDYDRILAEVGFIYSI